MDDMCIKSCHAFTGPFAGLCQKIHNRMNTVLSKPSIGYVHRNAKEYPNPEEFKPERFLRNDDSLLTFDSLTEGHYTFGFGRRKCPAYNLASKSVWIAIVRLLWAFDIRPCLGSDGKPIYPDPNDCTSGMSS
ncbi:Cytochrome P450 705A20 [Termitomyces sp. J132]|nr:Cytochrome P450 705A20 [Termitomyces sp. J132]